MANENNIGGLISTNNPQITINRLSTPSSFNDTRAPKLLTLFERNSNLLYTKYSYYSSDGEGKGFTSQQPFFAVNPSNVQLGSLKSNSTLNSKKKSDSRTSPYVSADEDVIRIKKFLKTSVGHKFTANQFILQGLQPFNETKIYNPLMPILSSGRGRLGVISRPTRFVELNVGGIFGALGLKAVSTVLFGKSNPSPPPGTATGKVEGFFSSLNPFSSRLPGALPVNRQDGGKGLTRGATASAAYKNLTDYWAPKNKGLLGKLLDIGNFIRSDTALGALLPIGQPSGTKFKGDESSYDLMILNGTIQTAGKSSGLLGRIKSFFLGSSPAVPRFVWTDINGDVQYGIRQKWAKLKTDKRNGYNVASVNENNQPETANNVIPITNYSKVVTLDQSEILLNYNNYINDIRGTGDVSLGSYPTKLNNPSNENVKLIENQSIKFSDANGSKYRSTDYNQDSTTNSWEILKRQKTVKSKSTDNILSDSDIERSTYIKRFSSDVLSKQLLDSSKGKQLSSKIKDPIGTSNPTRNKKPFENKDLIRFWFYDIANGRYIPFRATMKSISERYTTDWDNFQYIGNADKIYNYKGFTRNLGFTFTVVANDVSHLLPMWTRINYLLNLSKPAKYFNDEFIVPPLVKLTIGDMYKDQPIVISNMTLTVPDNATWETLPQETDIYNYNSNLITRTGDKIAQMPMEADLTVDCYLIEINKPKTLSTTNFGWSDTTTLGAVSHFGLTMT